MTCGIEFTRWFWTGPWLVTCRLPQGHDGEHNEVPDGPSIRPVSEDES